MARRRGLGGERAWPLPEALAEAGAGAQAPAPVGKLADGDPGDSANEQRGLWCERTGGQRQRRVSPGPAGGALLGAPLPQTPARARCGSQRVCPAQDSVPPRGHLPGPANPRNKAPLG